MRKRITSLLLTLVMLVGVLPVTAFAEDVDDQVVYGKYVGGVWEQDDSVAGGSATDSETGITLSKTATPTADPNVYDITLTVQTSTTTTTVAGSAATVLIIDVSGSMNYCAECGEENQHSRMCSNYSRKNNSVTDAQKRLTSAKNAAKSFLETYGGVAADSGRCLAIVAFSTSASTVLDWTDVSGGSAAAGYQAAVSAIDRLRAAGGTNLDAALKSANSLLGSAAAGTGKFVVALTDGKPTYYTTSNGATYGPGNNSNQNVLDATQASAASLKQNAALYTVCFGVADQKCWEAGDNIADSNQNGNIATTDCPYTVGEFLKQKVATDAAHAFNANSTTELMSAFSSITEDITSGLTIDGAVVTDPMGPDVTCTPPVGVEGVEGNENGFTWELRDPVVETENNVTTYTYTLTYTVTLDTTGEDFDENAYHPTNRETYLTVQDEQIYFPVPGVKGVVPTCTVTYAPGEHGTLAGTDAGNAVSASVKYGWATPEAPDVTPDNGYYFTGWDKEIAKTVTEDVTYTAQYAPQESVPSYVPPATPSVAPPVTPPDVPPATPDQPTLNCEDHTAYIIGYDDGTVRPQNNITRAEVATVFFRLLSDESRAGFWSQENEYSDVELTDWFNNAVSTLSDAEIITGYPDGSFKPNASITRAEFAAIAVRFSETVYSDGCTFTDVPEDHWAARYIALAEHLGWITGYPDGSFKPDQAITRAEAVTLINRVLERAVEEEHMLPDMVTWADNLPDDWFYEAVQEATNSHEYTRLEERVSDQNFNYEDWTAILPVPDWAALEKVWSTANSK